MDAQLMSDTHAKTSQWEKDSLPNRWSWENWVSTCTRVELEPYLIPSRKLNDESINS